MHDAVPFTLRRLGIVSGAAVAVLCLAYVCVLAVGLLTLPSPVHQIQQPWFFLMELLILGIAPALVVLSIALHAWAVPDRKAFALAGVVFISMSATVTCVVHFATLTLSTHPTFARESWAPLVFSFSWPSVAYALDILAWDIFFALGALFLAIAMSGAGSARVARALMFTSAMLAFVGVVGVPIENMQVRTIGIIGYAVLFPVAAGVLAKLFHQANAKRAA